MVGACLASVAVMVIAGPALRDGGPTAQAADTQPQHQTERPSMYHEPYGGCKEAPGYPFSDGWWSCLRAHHLPHPFTLVSVGTERDTDGKRHPDCLLYISNQAPWQGTLGCGDGYMGAAR